MFDLNVIEEKRKMKPKKNYINKKSESKNENKEKKIDIKKIWVRESMGGSSLQKYIYIVIIKN